MGKIQIFLMILSLISASIISFSGCGISTSRPEKPTVYIEKEFLDVLKQEQGNDIGETNNSENAKETEDSESINEMQSSDSQFFKQREFSISDLSEQDILNIMERTIGTVLQCVPNKIYYSRSTYDKTSDFAIQYLQKMVSMYERDYAVFYGEVTGTSYEKYVCWSREKVGYYLDILFGGQFSEYDLVCDGDKLLYYNGQYYIGVSGEIEEYHITIQYDKEDVDRSDFVYIMLEENDGRERISGQVAISVINETLDYADRYIFEMIVEE